MTAPVITDGITRIPLVPGSNASVNGDKIATLPLVHRAPGQLWERIAETTPNLATLSHATTAAIWEVGCRPNWRDERGPQSRPIHHSGVIRARQRIK